ncbi:PREDICTED: autophagy-related protein 101-like [Priapulus caudatus]|uniref:Autophagy-related protein 101 n=1 Tax=Priapulus caudatus TaxID=37621 RepID=A0ABM1F3J8_PRICU|nr:PREDICTED: autophagy-related protein 101-like [Priapulus caudatus]
MNARSQIFELSVEGRQIEETIASIFHTLLFHRTLGKFHYKQEGSYSVGTVGMEDVDCDFIDLTYMRVASDELDKELKREIASFQALLRASDGPRSGQITLEFYQKKRTRWPFSTESIPWEVWTVRLNVMSLANELERQVFREQVGEAIAEKIMYICESMNKHEYTPKMPNQSELESVFDVRLPDVQPYLFKITYQTTALPNPALASTMKKFLKDTLAF